MKKLLTILVLIMLIISFFQITTMFALYKEQLQKEYNTLLGAWEIRVNGNDVTTSGQVETFTIANNQLGYVNSDYIQAGKIAPKGRAYFDIVIDPSNIYIDEDENENTVYNDVSIIYTIELDKDVKSSTNTDIELVDAIKIVKGENYFGKGENGQTNKTTNNKEVVNVNANTYTSVMPLTMIKQGFKNYVRVYFEWNNVEVNNALDTQLGTTENAKITIPLKVNLKQYTGTGDVIGDE